MQNQPEEAIQQPERTILERSSHPVALVFHILFKLTALFLYILGRMLVTSNAVLQFVLIILMLAFDFWTVKNVTGRLLVGLRWWNHVKEDGSSDWVFESRQTASNATDSKCFWYSMYVFGIVWAVLALLALFNLQVSGMLIASMAFLMNLTNVIGYTNCDKDAKAKLTSYVAGQGFVQSMVSGAITRQLFAGQ